MKHISLYFAFYLSFVIPWLTPIELNNNNNGTSSEMLSCSPACQILDSLSLVDFYNQTNLGSCPSTAPSGWGDVWILTDPVCTWPGVTLNATGFVTSIVLNSNGLTGNIPVEVSNLTQLEVLFLSNNCLTGTIPTEIGFLTNLTSLFLDGNELVGDIPESLCDLTLINSIFLDENGLTGTIPECFNDLDQLLRLDIFDNCIDSIPDLSGMLSMQPGKFKVYNNKLTFDDILPNIGDIGTFYEPQDSFCIDQSIQITTGSTYGLDLNIDDGITNNSYQWYKDGVIYGSPTNSNTLVFSPVTFDAAGTYHCQVTNPGAPDLTLQSRCKTLVVVCGNSTFDFTPDVCSGFEVDINGVTYNEGNPCGNTVLTGMDQYGCDSIINVCLNFITPSPSIIDTTLCSGESITVNGTVYDINNTSGVETIGPPDMYNCDSTVQVDVSFFPPAVFNYEPIVCLDDTITFEGQEFHFADSTGQIILSGSSFHGCDSIINVDLDFWPLATSTVTGNYCDGQNVTINGTVYNTANPSGVDTLYNQNWRGCDSIVIVDLTFGGGVEVTRDDIICEGQSILVNGTTYDCDNPSGTETIVGGSYTGCDSIITVDLTCIQAIHGSIDTMLCSGVDFEYNGTTYDGGNTDGTENLGPIGFNGCDSIVDVQVAYWSPAFSTIDTMLCANQSILVGGFEIQNSGLVVIEDSNFRGCDSTVYITIGVLPVSNNLIDDVLCPGTSIFVNGTEYDENNLTGTETISGGNMYGCDSIITIDISYGSAVVSDSEFILCYGDSLTVGGGVILNENNTTYTDTIIGGSQAGCDSITNISVSFYPEATGNTSETWCYGESNVINGTLVDENNPMYSDTLEAASFHGCDSIINVSVSFYPEAITNLTPTLCPEEDFLVGGEVINAGNPSDTIVLSGNSFHGCDSTIIVNATILTIPAGNYMTTLCPGDTIVINGTTYDEDNTTGTETITMGSFNNCDTSFTVLIDFYPAAVSNIDSTLCDGASMDVGGVTFDANNPGDTVIIAAAGFYGCDSMVIVNLDFYPPATALLDNTLCFGQSITVNGTIYDELNPDGEETLAGASFYGCDSIVTIDLTFNNSVEVTLDPILCDINAEVIVNGTTYNFAMPMGTETMEGFTGCDSIVTVDLFYPDTAFIFHNNTLCPGENITVNGTVYNEDTPQGQEIIPGSSLYGCDVYHIIDLSYYPVSEYFINETLCFGEDTLINGVLFDSSHITDTIVLSGAAYTSCDSFVIVNINFYSEIVFDLTESLCTGQSIFVGGVEYNEAMPTGTEVLTSYTGCDSTVNINLSFDGAVVNNINESICEGDSISINGTSYHMGNPMGMDTIPFGSAAGCDSVLNVVISFLPHSYNNIDTILCPGDELLLSGVIYNSSNSTGSDTLVGQSYNGCDSILNITLSYYPPSVSTIDTLLCAGDTLTWNGMEYTMPANFSDTIYGGSYTGCDSILQINLDFLEAASSTFNTMLCFGDSLLFNGTIFNAANVAGVILLPGESYSGCDSIINVMVGFYPLAEATEVVTICEGENLEWNGQIYNMTGVHVDTLTGQSYTGCDSIATLDLTVLTAAALGLANAGADFITCEETITLSGNQPTDVTGMWTVLSGSSNIINPQNAVTSVNNMTQENLSLVWTLSSTTCPNYDADTIHISSATIPDAVDDNYSAEEGITLVPLSLLENDQLHSISEWYFNILNTPTGDLQDLGNGTFNYTAPDELLGSLVTFQYELCNEDCPDNCDTAMVSIQLQAIDIPEFPNTITANGDGVNDFFVIPELEETPDQFPNKELIIFNRWGDIVYQAKPYLNDWNGTNAQGKELPQATYYFVLRLDVGEGIIYRGDVTILR